MNHNADPTDSEPDNHSMYKSFIEEAQQGVLIFQGDPPRIVYANPAMTRISGYTNSELLSLTLEELQELTHPQDRENVFEQMDEFLKGYSKPMQYTYRALRKNGSVFWAELTANIIQHQEQPAILVGLLDVTIMKDAERRIAEERDRAQLYLDWAGVMFLALDPDGSIVLLNQKSCEVLGCTLEDAVGKDWFDTFVPERERSDSRKAFDSLITGEINSLREVERHIITLNGDVKLVSWYTTVLRDSKDVIIGILSSGVDITERRRAEEALLNSKQKFRTLVEHLPVVTWTSDKEGNTIYISPNVEQIYGYTPEEIEQGGQDLWFGSIHPDDVDRVQVEYQKSIKEKTSYDIIYRIQRKDGEWIWIRDTSTKTYEVDRTFFASGMFTDITDKKKMELALEESEEKYRTLIENMQDGVVIIQDGNLVFTNN
ncbi:MAG: PAS domain S-box protein, partial [Candidatus Thorarchaeota archaeon]|nr:PAS domain S-box protein [Candidatus Thorarchaeota archaeon]